MLVIGAVDVQMIEAVLFAAGEHSLKAAQLLVRGFGPVLIKQQNPPPGGPDKEVSVVAHGKGGEVSFHS
ncbi:hypothetical protein GCM10017708_19420 [Arthrobacter citreus]